MLPTRLERSLTDATCEGSILSVRFTDDGSYVLSGGRDRLVRLWNPHSGLLVKTYKGHGFEVNDAVASKDNARIISASSDKQVLVWDVVEGTVERRLRGHTARVNVARIVPDGTVVFSGAYDATVRAWDLRGNSQEPIQIIDDAKDSITSLVTRAHELITGSVDGHVRRYDMRMGQLHVDFVDAPVTNVSLSHDNNCVLVSTLDNTMRLLDKENGELLSDYVGHKNKDYRVESGFSPDDSHVVSGSEDGHLFFWDLVEGTVMHQQQAHPGSVVSTLSYHPSKRMVISGAADGSIHVWGA